MNIKRLVKTLLFGSVFVLILLNILFSQSLKRVLGQADFYKDLDIFADAVHIIQRDYVEETAFQHLITTGIRSILESLDSHCYFLDPDIRENVRLSEKSRYVGIGLKLAIRDEILTVITPLDDTPACHAGIKSNDRIVKIDGQITDEFSLLKALALLRGDSNTDVTLTVFRPSEKRFQEFTVKRKPISMESIGRSELFNSTIGYIKITCFQKGCSREFEKAFSKLKEKGMKSFILDLRNNPGGLIDEAVAVSRSLLDEGNLITSTKSRIDAGMTTYTVKGSLAENIPVVVLVNGGTAGVAEVLAGAVQHWKKGAIMGSETFGECSIQSIISIDRNAQVNLTIAKYLTPKGEDIDGVGITPDIIIEAAVSEEEESHEVSGKEYDKEREQEKHPGPISEEAEDMILHRAVDLLKGVDRLINPEK